MRLWFVAWGAYSAPQTPRWPGAASNAARGPASNAAAEGGKRARKMREEGEGERG